MKYTALIYKVCQHSLQEGIKNYGTSTKWFTYEGKKIQKTQALIESNVLIDIFYINMRVCRKG